MKPTASYVTYARHPSADGETELVAKIFRDESADEPQPLLVWFHSGAYHTGSIESRAHRRFARRFSNRGYTCAFVQYRLRAREEDLAPATRDLLPELVADADANAAEIRPNMTGPRALAAVEDGAAFIKWSQEHKEELGLSGRVVLGGSSAGGITVLNLLSLGPRLGLKLPEIPTAFVMSGAFAYPGYFTPQPTRILALHGSYEHQLPVSSIRAFAARSDANCTLLEERDHVHGDLALVPDEPLWKSVDRLVKFDQGEDMAPERTATEGEPVKDSHRICIYTCVKNEGPFLLEWIAHNRAIGVTDFVVFSNDCTDGTAELLDRLDEMGIINHIPNPSMALKSREHLRLTVACAPFHKAFYKADYAILTDADEFIQINVGDGTLNGLIAATGYPDVLSLSEALFGFDRVKTYRDDLVTEQFRATATLFPSEDQARRGVKSIMKVTRDIAEYSNHRPRLAQGAIHTIRWLDGAGVPVKWRFMKRGERGFSARHRYRLARINHYTLRSGESMLVKFQRGDAVRPARMKPDYFSDRNGNDILDHGFDRHLPGLRAELKALKQDKTLARLHRNCVDYHKKMIKALKQDKAFAPIWEQIQEEVARPLAGEPETSQAAE